MEIVTDKDQKHFNTLFVAIPDTGLVSNIIAQHIIEALNFKEIGQVRAKDFRRIVLLDSGYPKFPVRLFGSTNGEQMVILKSEIPIDARDVTFVNNFSDLILKYAKENNFKRIIIASGMPDARRPNMTLDDLEIFAIANTKSGQEIIEKLDKVKPFQEGVITGIYASIIATATEENFPLEGFYVSSFPNFPDPSAAAKMIKEVINVHPDLEMKLSVDTLLEKGDELQLQLHRLASETRQMRTASAQPTYL